MVVLPLPMEVELEAMVVEVMEVATETHLDQEANHPGGRLL